MDRSSGQRGKVKDLEVMGSTKVLNIDAVRSVEIQFYKKYS